MKLLSLILKGNPVKSIAILVLIFSSIWWYNSGMTHYTEEQRIYTEILSSNNGVNTNYYITINSSEDLVLSKYPSGEYDIIEKDGVKYMTYPETEPNSSLVLSFILMIVSLVTFIFGHWEEGYCGWEYKQIKREYLFTKVNKIIDGDHYYYILNGRVLNEGTNEMDSYYGRDLTTSVKNKISTYMTNPNVFPKYEGTKSEIILKEKETKLKRIVEILDEN